MDSRQRLLYNQIGDVMKKKNSGSRFLAYSGLFAAVICVLAPISVPIGTVPVTLSLFGVMLAGIVLEPAGALAAVTVYILVGTIGVPVFSGWRCGPGILIGATGGYIWSYLPMVYMISKIKGNSIISAFFACFASLAVCYTLGTLQFILVSGVDLSSALAVCVLPFIPADVLKSLCAALLGVKLRGIANRKI